MNPVLHEGIRNAQHGWVSGVALAVALLIFLGWMWWTFSAHNTDAFEQAALIPLEEKLPAGDKGIVDGDKGTRSLMDEGFDATRTT